MFTYREGVDLQALRTFVAVAETGQFQAAADDLRISQQAVSKRVAALEKHLGVTLLVRSSRGSRVSLDGQAFLPHAKKILAAVEQAQQAVHPQRRPLRVDVLNRRIAPAQAVYAFYRANPSTALDTVSLAELGAVDAVRTVLDGSVDASFRAIRADQIPPGVRAERLLDTPLQLLVGPAHPLAGADQVRPEDLAGHRVWIPGIRPGTEWADFYRALSQQFGLTIDALGPHFGDEALMDALADSADLATLVGAGDRYLWPDSYRLRRIPLRDPTPLYPHVLLTRAEHRHPVLGRLRDHLRAHRTATADPVWTPDWVAA